MYCPVFVSFICFVGVRVFFFKYSLLYVSGGRKAQIKTPSFKALADSNDITVK